MMYLIFFGRNTWGELPKKIVQKLGVNSKLITNLLGKFAKRFNSLCPSWDATLPCGCSCLSGLWHVVSLNDISSKETALAVGVFYFVNPPGFPSYPFFQGSWENKLTVTHWWDIGWFPGGQVLH